MELLAFGDAGWGDELLAGAWLTIRLAITSLIFGLAGGLVLAMAGLSTIPPLRWFADAFLLIIRGVPEFLILLLVFFGLERAVQTLLQAVGVDIAFEMPKFTAAVIGLSLIFSAYASEIFRGAYQAIPKGQMEAARSLGLTALQAFRFVRLPQMWIIALPGLSNLWMVLLKDTSLAAVIALEDLLRQAKVASEATREPLLFYAAAGIIYLVMTAASDIMRTRLEKRLANPAIAKSDDGGAPTTAREAAA